MLNDIYLLLSCKTILYLQMSICMFDWGDQIDRFEGHVVYVYRYFNVDYGVPKINLWAHYL